MRGRSFHSRRITEVSSKGSILELNSNQTKVLENRDVSVSTAFNHESTIQNNFNEDSFITFVKKELQLYKNPQNEFKGLIFKKDEFWFACYKKIQGNISSTGNNENRVNGNCILNLIHSIDQGRFQFNMNTYSLNKLGGLSAYSKSYSKSKSKIPLKDILVLKGLATVLDVL